MHKIFRLELIGSITCADSLAPLHVQGVSAYADKDITQRRSLWEQPPVPLSKSWSSTFYMISCVERMSHVVEIVSPEDLDCRFGLQLSS